MSLDLSRITFDAHRDFLGVVMQQGRVQLDADWNEWVAQVARRLQAGTLDTLGEAVVPRGTPDGFLIQAAGGALTIGRGRIYVDGLLAENHGTGDAVWDTRLAEEHGAEPIDYFEQPYLPEPPALPESAGPHLVYLDVWQREISPVQAPELIEPAVGVDTTGRVQTVWQVRLLADVGDITCSTPDEEIPNWLEETRPSAGRLTTDTADPPDEPNPCVVPPGSGYRGLENQLYRVEIHDRGPGGAATFKWSRDNATVATRVLAIPELNRLVVESTGKDDVLRFSDGDWIEITDDGRELSGEPGIMRRIKLGGGVDDATRTIELETPLAAGDFPVDGLGEPAPELRVRIRRWDQSGEVKREDGSTYFDLDASGDGVVPVPAGGTRLFLEHGVVIEFSVVDGDPTGEFHVGDWWAFAARAADASIEVLDAEPPRGIHHHYARLALVTFPDKVTDCRTLWPPLAAGVGCDCTICVTVEGHNEGTATIQQAIDRVAGQGGSICLGVGTYQIAKPLRIQRGVSLRLRGQGSGTLLLSRNPGSVIEMENGSDVTLENFAVLGAAGGSTTTAVVAARNMLDLVVRNLVLVGVASGDATSAALSVTGYLLGGRVEDSVLIAERGVVGLDGDEEALLLGHWGMTNNLVFASQRGLSFGDNSFYFSGVRLRDNLVLGTSDRGIGVTGGALLDCGVDVTGNTIYTSGDGIVCGTSRVRIRGNDLLPMTQAGGNGIVVETGAEPHRIEALSIMDNRVTGIDGHGVVIRAPVRDGMIKQNRFEQLGGGGIVVEQSGSAGYLVIENNHFFDIGRVQEDTDRGYAGLDLVGVERADVLNNVMVDIASGAVASPRIDAVLIAGSEHLRLGGNRIEGVGADRGAGLIAAIHVDTPVSQLQIDGNSISRSSSQRQLTGDASWLAVLVDARSTDRTDRTDVAGERVATAPDLRRAAPSVASRPVSETSTYAYVRLDNRAAFVTPHRVVVRDATPDSTLLRGNYLTATATSAPLVALMGIESCTLVENDCRSPGAGTGRNLSLVGIAMADYVNLSNNRLVGADDVGTFDIRSERFAAMGNLSTGDIQVFGAPLPAPWDQFNTIGG